MSQRSTGLVRELLPIVVVWVMSFVLYTTVPGFLGYELSYSTHPFLSALYYAAWLGAFIGFYPELIERIRISLYPRWYVAFALVVLSAILFYTQIIPLLTTPEEISAVVRAHPEAPFFDYGPLYMLPKSVEIFFQQALIVEAVYIVAAYIRGFLVASLTFGMLLAGIHLVSVVYAPSSATLAMVAISGVAGALMPTLILRVRNGVVYSYGLHWLFYALLAVHFLVTR